MNKIDTPARRRTPYVITREAGERRDWIRDRIWGLHLVAQNTREDIITAWVTTWSSSAFEDFMDVPFAAGMKFPLLDHVNEVTRTGMDLAKRAREEWGIDTDLEILVPILILHDVDKPLLTVPAGETTIKSPLAREMAHGVIGAMLLKELGFDHEIVSHVSLHAHDSPFYRETPESLILTHADYFSADHVMLAAGLNPFYQKPHPNVVKGPH